MMRKAEQLSRLIYYSRNRIAGSPAAIDAEIRGLLAVARQKNAVAGVTGALMFNHACFAQVLEGPRQAVEDTYHRIQEDPRHSDIEFLALNDINARSFSRWSMAFVGAPGRARETYRDIADGTGFDPRGMMGDAVMYTLQALVADTETLTNPAL